LLSTRLSIFRAIPQGFCVPLSHGRTVDALVGDRVRWRTNGDFGCTYSAGGLTTVPAATVAITSRAAGPPILIILIEK